MYVNRPLHADDSRSARVDVIVTTNMFGDIITDLVLAFRVAWGCGQWQSHPGRLRFRAGPRFRAADRGENIANPIGAILTAAMMLAHLG